MRRHLLLTLAVCGNAFAAPTMRTSFDHDWKFARFGTMPDGSMLKEPGAPTNMIAASSAEAANPAANAVDGDKATRWCASGQLNDQTLTLDLGHAEKLGGLRVIWEKATKNPFSVQVSDNGGTWREVAPKHPSAAAEETEKFTTTARYIRLTADSGPAEWASVREMEVLDPQGNKITPRPADAGDAALKPENPAFTDADWRTLDLPHDWAIEGPFRMELENETGKLSWVGIGWYRKTFDLPASVAGQRVFLDFDGAMAQPKVYINGTFASEWKYGYSSFRIDLTKHLKAGKNTLAVRIENLPASTRWYPGAGIYRHVWWVESPPVHIGEWGVYVTTPKIKDAAASVAIETTVDNNTDKVTDLTVLQEILDPAGKVVASKDSAIAATTGAPTVLKQSLTVANPKRWNIKSPNLYVVRSSLLSGDTIIDSKTTNLGIREVAWDAQKGFLLNGRKVVLQGVCNHHDLGPLGSAVHTRALERQIEILQEMGCNAIRTAHNPPANEFLDLCDRKGMLVLDELFDIWKMQKYGKNNGYNIY